MQSQSTRGLASNPVANRILGMNLGRAFGTPAMNQADGNHGDDVRDCLLYGCTGSSLSLESHHGELC